MENIKFFDVLKKILNLVVAAILKIKETSVSLKQSMLDAIMDAVIILFCLSRNKTKIISAS